MYKTAVVCYEKREFDDFIRIYNLNPDKYIWIPSLESASGRFFNGYIVTGKEKYRDVLELYSLPVEEMEEIIKRENQIYKERLATLNYIEMNTRRSVQDCLDYLEEKRKVLHWLIEGYGKTGLPLSAVRYLTIYRICELYNVDINYFNKI